MTQSTRFVVLRHEVGSRQTRTDQLHFDWMFEVDGRLRTWATQPIANFQQPIDIACDSLSDHRLTYLDYEGEIEGDRGQVTRLLRGTHRLIQSDADRFVATLAWDESGTSGEATVTCYRSLPEVGLRLDDSRDFWRLRFSLGR